MVNVVRVQTPPPPLLKNNLSPRFFSEEGGGGGGGGGRPYTGYDIKKVVRNLDQNTDPHEQYAYRNISRRRA